jgi:uncharacterized membrane protein
VIKRKLRELPKNEIAAVIEYFDESISERMDRGMSEEEAVAAMGNPEEAVGNIIAEMPDEVREDVKKESGCGGAMKIFVLICALPFLVSLLAVAVSVAVSLLAVYLAVVISIFAAALGCAAGALGCITMIFISDSVGMLLGMGAGCVCAGLAIMFMLCGIALVRAAVTIVVVRKNARRGKRVIV